MPRSPLPVAVRSAVLTVSALVMVVASTAALVACSGSNATPTNASGLTLPMPDDPGTLLPVPDNTLPSEISTTLPADALFGGDLCGALLAVDFTRTTLGGAGTGRLLSAEPLSEDSCAYTVAAGSKEFTVVVQARSQGDFLSPGTTDEVIDEINDLGLAARGVDHGDTYTVIVKVENGFFAVTAPERASAVSLAAAAIPRALPG